MLDRTVETRPSVPQNGGNGLVLERYGGNGGSVHWEGVAYHKTRLHGLLFISTVDCLHGLLFISIVNCLHGLLFIQPSTGYCSTNPPRGPVHPALHGVLFIHPQSARSGSCSSSGNDLYYHGVLFIQPPTRSYSSKPPNNADCSSREGCSSVRSASVSGSSERRNRLIGFS